MILAHTDLTAPITLSETKPTCLVIENTKLFRYWVETLSAQCDGEEATIILSSRDKEHSFSKEVVLVRDPLFLTQVENNISKYILKEMEDCARLEHIEATRNLIQQIVEYAELLCSQSPLGIEPTGDIDYKALIKLLQIVPDWSGDFLDRLSHQMKLAQLLLLKKLFIFVGLKSYLDKDELEAFYKECVQYQMPIILIETKQNEQINDEQLIIIDASLCELRFS